VGPHRGRILGSDQCLSAFRAAVQAAVQEWRFAPAFRQTKTPGRELPSGGTSLPQWDQEPIAIFVDLEFIFEARDGQGIVRAN
jgi:hypothetical protein